MKLDNRIGHAGRCTLAAVFGIVCLGAAASWTACSGGDEKTSLDAGVDFDGGVSGDSGAEDGWVDSGTPDAEQLEDGGFIPEPGERSEVYPADWCPKFETTRESDGELLFIQDFSYAGYVNGEVPLPTGDFNQILEVSAVNDGSEDVSDEIQAALDDAAAIPVGAIVFLPAGTYRLDVPIAIRGSNVVLRGEGPSATRLWFKDGGGASEPIALLVTGSSWLSEEESEGWEITREGKVFERFVETADPAGLSPGDDISITWRITAAFKEEHSSEDYWYHVEEGTRRTFFRRTITGIDGNRVYFKTPLRYDVKLRDEPVVLKVSNYASKNGVERLAVSTAMGDPASSWNSGVNHATAIDMRFCKDCWIQDVQSFAHGEATHHLRSYGVSIDRSFRVTVADTHLEKSEHLGGGGNGYLFQLTRTNEVLVRDSSGRDGRHNFSINWDFGASGNVFLRIVSEGGLVCSSLQAQLDNSCSLGPSDFHHALAIANLFDNSIIDDALQVGNRRDWSTGGGQTGTMNVFWNINGTGNVYAYNQGMGYVVGTGPDIQLSTDLDHTGWLEQHLAEGTEPEDFSDFVGDAADLAPQSLYEEQLARRLGAVCQ